ncbi:MAG: hypothetical protein R2826_03600 [Thermoleophilia bacterium]
MAHEARVESEEDVYRELGRALGGAPDATVWKLLQHGRWPQDVIGEEASFAELLSEYRTQLAIIADRQVQPRSATREPLVVGAPWTEALAKIMALQAAKDPYVVAFRSQVLGNRLLAPEEVNPWIRERLAACGSYTRQTRPDMLGAVVGPRANAWESELAVQAYVEGSAPPRTTQAESELDFLDCLGDVLISSYGFYDPDSLRRFVLSGETPRLAAILAAGRYREGFPQAGETIVMHVSPRCPPKQMLAAYSELRQRVLPERQRVRQPDEDDLELAVFIAEVNDGRTWEDAAAAWNDAHEEARRYQEKRSFSRDARGAYQRVVGSEIEWQGKAQARRGHR